MAIYYAMFNSNSIFIHFFKLTVFMLYLKIFNNTILLYIYDNLLTEH